MTTQAINRDTLSERVKPTSLNHPLIAVAATLLLATICSMALTVISSVNDSKTTSMLLHGTCWRLVVLGVAGTYLAGTGLRTGWLILLGLQPIWISYALVTDQHGFRFSRIED